MADSYLHPKCGKRVKNTAYHCARCHESFIGLTAFDAHQVARPKGGSDCFFLIAADAYAAKAAEFWYDEDGYLHRGRKMTDEEKAEIWGAKVA